MGGLLKILLLVFLYLLPPYAGASQEDLLTAKERAWLNAHPNITLAMWSDYEPISYYDEYGNAQGYMADYIKLLEGKLNVRFKQVKPVFGNRYEKWRVVNADIVSLEAQTPVRLEYYNFTSPIFNYPLHLVARQDAADALNLTKLEGKKVSVVRGYATEEFIHLHYPKINLDIVENTCEGLQHVAFGQAEAIFTDLPIAGWCLKSQGLINLKSAGTTEFTYKMGMAVRKDWPILNSILDKGIKAISKNELQKLELHWIGEDIFERSWLERNRFLLSAMALFVLCLMTLALYFWDSRAQQRLLGHGVTDTLSAAETQNSQTRQYKYKRLVFGILIFLVLMALVSGVVATQYNWHFTGDRWMLWALSASMAIITLYGGYKLGSVARTGLIEGLMLGLAQQIKSRQAIEQKMLATAERLEVQNSAIVRIAELLRNSAQTDIEKYQKLTEICAQTIGVARVGLWMLMDDRKTLSCVDLYDQEQNRHSADATLLAKDYPIYFKALASHRTLAVSDAMQDAVTGEFVNDYLPKYNISAMLDSIIWFSGNLNGVLCSEHCGKPRHWTLDEINFIGAVTDLLQAQIEASRRQRLENDLEYQQKHLESMVQARTAVIENNARLSRFLVDKAPVSIVYLDANLNIIEVNPEAEKYTGVSREFAQGKNYIDLVPPHDRENQKRIFDRVIAGEKILGERMTIKSPDGRVLELSVSRSMELDSDGNPIIISIAQDVSQQKVLEESLIRAKEAAESADRIKSMFVASMSHELRTPLNSIIGFLGVVLHGMSGELNLKQKDQLTRAYNSAKHLLSLITDVIDISKIEAGFLQVQVEHFALETVMHEIEHSVHHLAQEKDMRLIMDCSSAIQLETDRKRLYQVLLNVVSNAFKYSEHGHVEVIAAVKGKKLIIKVKDTGIGMKQADVAALFKPFMRAESHLKIKTLGTGLGLYLTRKILTQLLGGEVAVTSEVGVGSEFTISLPLKLPKSKLQKHHSILEPSSL